MPDMTQLLQALQTAKAQRKNGELDERGFYVRLLELSAQLAPILIQEVQDTVTVMSDKEVRMQIPLVLAFLEDQIARFRAREAQH